MLCDRILCIIFLLLSTWEDGHCKTGSPTTENKQIFLQLLRRYLLQSEAYQSNHNEVDMDVKCLIYDRQRTTHDPEMSCANCWSKAECSGDPFCLANCQPLSRMRHVFERLEYLEKREYFYAITIAVIICIAILIGAYMIYKLCRDSKGNFVKPCHPTSDRDDILPGVIREDRIFIDHNRARNPQTICI